MYNEDMHIGWIGSVTIAPANDIGSTGDLQDHQDPYVFSAILSVSKAQSFLSSVTNNGIVHRLSGDKF